MINLANSITLFRILSSIFFIFPLSLYYFKKVKNSFLFLSLLIAIFLTDFFDGYIARSFNQQTIAGKIMDPIADKIAINACILPLVIQKIIPLSIPFFLINRDIFVMGIKMYAEETKQSLETSFIAKIKTFLLMILIILSYTAFPAFFPKLYLYSWYLIIIYSYYSLYEYMKLLL